MDNAYLNDFPPQTVDKVERLLDLLGEIEEHPGLRGKLALHGGTAINLFMLDLPRLSVDIDLSYVGATEKDAILKDRPLMNLLTNMYIQKMKTRKHILVNLRKVFISHLYFLETPR